MITVRSPLRLGLGGGGTDLPSFYERAGGAWISTALDLSVEVQVEPIERPAIVLRQGPSAGPADLLEEAATAEALAHPIVRAALETRPLAGTGLVVTMRSPVPPGTGLGSSGSLAVALELALATLDGEAIGTPELAERGHRTEVRALGPTAGKQDPWIAAIGGTAWFRAATDGTVTHGPVDLPVETRAALSRGLMLFATGGTRSSAAVLADQQLRSSSGDGKVLENLHRTMALGHRTLAALEDADLDRFGALLHEHWCTKRERSPGMSDPEIDRWYECALRHGATGGKLVGAGGRGYLLLYAAAPAPVRAALADQGLAELAFELSAPGAALVGP